MATQPDLALLLGAEASLAPDTSEGRNALFSSLVNRPGLVGMLHGAPVYVSGLAASADGRTLVLAACRRWSFQGHCGRPRLIIWDPNGRKRLREIPLPNPAFSVAISLDGKILASDGCASAGDLACEAGEIRLWNMSSGSALPTSFKGYDGPVDELAFAAGRLAPRRGNLLIPWDPDTQRQIARRELSSIEVEAFATTTAEDAVVVWMANTSQPSTTVIWRRSAFDQPGEPVFKQEKLRDISGAATARSLRLPDVPWTREKGFATVAKFVCGMSTRRRKKGEPPGAFTTGSAVSPSATMGKFSQQAVAGDGKIVVASKANCACGTHRPAAKSANLLPDTRTSLRGHSGAGLGLA